jgi:ribosomal protein S18 acetylase RimI-like enzyme
VALLLRPLRAEDRAAIAEVLAATGAFSSEEIAVALELVDGGEEGGYHFCVAEIDGDVAGYTCYGRALFTDGSWDLYWIAVAPDRQRTGVGGALLVAAEEAAQHGGGRMVVVETASKPSYLGARRFYERNGYTQVARVPGFYAEDDDKLIYCKSWPRSSL